MGWKLWRGESGRHMGTQIRSVSLAMSTATASFGVEPLSLVAEPVSTASVSGASNKARGLDYSVWGMTSIHPFSLLYQSNAAETGRWIWRGEVGVLSGGWRAKVMSASKHLLHTSNLAESLSPLLDKWACPDKSWCQKIMMSYQVGVQETEDITSWVCDE